MCHAHITLFQQGCTFCSAQTLVAPVLAAPLPQDKAQKPWEKMKPFQPHLPAGPTRSCERRNISRSCSVAQQPWAAPADPMHFLLPLAETPREGNKDSGDSRSLLLCPTWSDPALPSRGQAHSLFLDFLFCLAQLNPANWREVGSMPAELCSLRKQTVPSAGFP